MEVTAYIDNLWILIAGILVMFMQPGFMLVETGFTRSKNSVNIVMNTQDSFNQYISESAPSSHILNEIDSLDLKTLLEKHVFQTGSELASKLLDKENIWNKIFTVFGGIAEITDSKETSASNKINALD